MWDCNSSSYLGIWGPQGHGSMAERWGRYSTLGWAANSSGQEDKGVSEEGEAHVKVLYLVERRDTTEPTFPRLMFIVSGHCKCGLLGPHNTVSCDLKWEDIILREGGEDSRKLGCPCSTSYRSWLCKRGNLPVRKLREGLCSCPHLSIIHGFPISPVLWAPCQVLPRWLYCSGFLILSDQHGTAPSQLGGHWLPESWPLNCWTMCP